MTVADQAGSPDGRRGPRAGQPVRRTFSNSYKLKVVTEYDGLTEFGARGALLRREGLYQSHVEKWRKARDQGLLTAGRATPAVGSSRGDSGSKVLSENRKLKLENERLTAELAKTRAVLEIVGKAQSLLELLSRSTGSPTPSPASSTTR